MNQQNYPFTAIVGQDRMKKALVLNIINPKLSGVLIRGEKGTAKSTAVRSLAKLLPEIEVASECSCGCNAHKTMQLCPVCSKIIAQGEVLATKRRKIRVVDLPIGSTEDRVVGTIDMELAIKKGEKHFEPGILAAAHRGILYVDEVNLLDDHIVDVLLDAAAMGVNTVEREGISFSHPAEFVLIGTMNPEEGELRPQLLDRFGLCIQVEGISELDKRIEVVKRRAAFEEDHEKFYEQWRKEEENLSKSIETAKKLLLEVNMSDDMLKLIAEIAIEMKVDGHRADIVMMKAAKALSAFYGRIEVNRNDVLEAAEMTLPHRMRKKPFQKIGIDSEKLEHFKATEQGKK